MRICLYSGPGCGKSTLAAWLFSQLKMSHINVEFVAEYIKGWAWDKRKIESWDQYYIFAKQLHAEDKVLRHGVHIVTDSPLLMQVAYIQRQNNCYDQELLSACRKFDSTYPSININLTRSVKYNTEGRWENLDQAIEMDKRITYLLNDYGEIYQNFCPLDKEAILSYVLNELKTESK